MRSRIIDFQTENKCWYSVNGHECVPDDISKVQVMIGKSRMTETLLENNYPGSCDEAILSYFGRKSSKTYFICQTNLNNFFCHLFKFLNSCIYKTQKPQTINDCGFLSPFRKSKNKLLSLAEIKKNMDETIIQKLTCPLTVHMLVQSKVIRMQRVRPKTSLISKICIK